MRQFVTAITLYLALVLAPVQLAASSAGGAASLTPAQQAIRDAASIEDPRQREQTLRQTIVDGLSSEDLEVPGQVLSYLSQNSRWLDLRPYADVIEQFAKADSLHRGLWLLDDNELAHAPRAERLVVYRAAIEKGVTTLRRGRPLTRESAMAFAASEGMTEVEPLVVRFSAMVETRWKKSFDFEAFPTLFELGGGAGSREDALLIASQRLSAMPDKQIREKMNGDASFRGGVFQVARAVCETDPFSGRRNPGCVAMKTMIGRQIALERDVRKAVAESSAAGSGGPYEEKGEGWLARLRQQVPDAEMVERSR